ncbi:MAG TPA: threonine dehydratase [Microscillaceae bacterium]|nr:threonine dehydratase [Microscillaceae bacterium]
MKTALEKPTDSTVSVVDVQNAYQVLKKVVYHTPLQLNPLLSERYQAKVYLKREDLQVVRSYKIRGAYFKINSLTPAERTHGIVCASAGNHAQGVAYACQALQVKGTIYMPSPTPRQKVDQVRFFGKEWVDICLTGDTFDNAYEEARQFCQENQQVFIHPFDDPHVIAGQGTVGMEILADIPENPDYVLVPVGGGGLASGVGSYLKQLKPSVKLVGVEPKGAASMQESLAQQAPVVLPNIDKFVDGAAVQKVGNLTFKICQQVLDKVETVDEGQVCTTILKLYNEQAIVVEPAGALTIASLEQMKEEIKGKTVVCVVSGSNNDITRMEEIKEKSLLYEGLKHYFLIDFPQRSGALREFVLNALGQNDDITHFEYIKKHNKEKGMAVVGIELQHPADYQALIHRFEHHQVAYMLLNQQPSLLSHIL